MSEIDFSPDALADLEQIKTYITVELCSEQTAISTVSKIIRHIRMLADFPEAGAPLASVVNIASNYRFLVCGNYTAFYIFKEDKVHILRVLYGRRDFMRILFGETSNE